MSAPLVTGSSPAHEGTAASANLDGPPEQSEQESEPIWPQPQPFTANLLKRLSRGLGSWFGLLNEWDFRIGIGSTNVLGLELVLVNQPDLVRQVLVDQPDTFPKHPYTQWILEPLIGQGLFAVNGAEWQRQRRLVDQALQVTQLRRVFPLMTGAVQAMVERLEAQGGAQQAGPGRGPGHFTARQGKRCARHPTPRRTCWRGAGHHTLRQLLRRQRLWIGPAHCGHVIGGDIRPVVPVMLGLGCPGQHRRTCSQKNPAPHSLCLQLKRLKACAIAAPDQALSGSFSLGRIRRSMAQFQPIGAGRDRQALAILHTAFQQ